MIMLLYEERLFVKIQYQLMAKKKKQAKLILKWNWMWETFNETRQILGKPWCGFGE